MTSACVHSVCTLLGSAVVAGCFERRSVCQAEGRSDTFSVEHGAYDRDGCTLRCSGYLRAIDRCRC
jgi:hypothetical protein